MKSKPLFVEVQFFLMMHPPSCFFYHHKKNFHHVQIVPKPFEITMEYCLIFNLKNFNIFYFKTIYLESFWERRKGNVRRLHNPIFCKNYYFSGKNFFGWTFTKTLCCRGFSWFQKFMISFSNKICVKWDGIVYKYENVNKLYKLC